MLKKYFKILMKVIYENKHTHLYIYIGIYIQNTNINQ